MSLTCPGTSWHFFSIPLAELLDQRALPGAVEYVRLRTAAETAVAIRDMVTRGAPAIGCTAAYGFYLAAHRASVAGGADLHSFRAAMDAAYTILEASRPTAVNLRWALDRLRGVLGAHGDDVPLSDRAAAVLRDAHAIYAEDEAACRAMGAHGLTLPVIPRKGARIIHHCNTGSLATSSYGTALGLVRAAFDADPTIHVYVDETRPRLQGARLTAWECVQEGISHQLIVDSCAAVLMAAGKVDFCVVGADRIAADGSVANKVGTYSLAVNAKFHNVPFIVVAPTSTVDLSCASGADIPIEERNADEVTHPCGTSSPSVAPSLTPVFNPAFDVTPPALVTHIVTEHGIAEQETFRGDLLKLCGAARRK